MNGVLPLRSLYVNFNFSLNMYAKKKTARVLIKRQVVKASGEAEV